MVYHLRKKMNQLTRWGKIIFPTGKLRYYPPKFTLRNPMIEGVRSSFKQGHEVAVIVFNVTNLREILEQLGFYMYEKYISHLKNTFKGVVARQVTNDQIIVLHDYDSDGLTLLLRVNHDYHSVSDIEKVMNEILSEAAKAVVASFPSVQTIFNTGYMFVEKKHYSLEEAVTKAQQQAYAMAEKRVESEFNEMVYAMNKIVAQRDIRLLAQPIIDIATNQIQAWEMLTRGPKGTELESPLRLFSVARQTRMLYDLELIVFEKTMEQIKATGCQHNIFINFTPFTLGNERLIRDVKKLLVKYKNIPPQQITIEITERDSFEGMEHFIENIRILRKMGFLTAIDDTGAGYASLNSISEILPDIIKIDRSVIQNIDKNTVKESMLKGLLLVAKEAGSLVVAEGIESEEEASVLLRNHVDLAQGYYYAKPDSLHKGLSSF
ncbi:EAL domain-containing protein [Cytobacillus spongiae]|uniref:EAL domain-containing protein n=1 Tax=Cytobacillus spongiae TaxID=2901381 RepID=UPI001F2839E6|nr:EAL domain-containing protein [Cytobacillus spongiae]UII55414.1 EAL domain-containing protein [Cytobacillus spongiae]